MTFNEVIITILLIFIVTFCLYALVDRVCSCAEKVCFFKYAGEFNKKNCENGSDV